MASECGNPRCSQSKSYVQGAGYCSGSCGVVTNILERKGNLSQFSYELDEVALKLMEATHPGFLAALKKTRDIVAG